MSTVGENVEYSSPKQNSKHEEIAEYNGPKHNTKHDAQHPPTLYTSKSLNLSKYDFHLTICCFRKLETAAAIFFLVPKIFCMTGSQKYHLRLLRCEKKQKFDDNTNYHHVEICSSNIFLSKFYFSHMRSARGYLREILENQNHHPDTVMNTKHNRNQLSLSNKCTYLAALPYSLLQELYHDFAVPVSRSFQPCKEVQEQTHSTNDLPCCLPCSWRIPCNEHSIEIDEAKPADDEAEPADYDPLLELTFEFFKDYNEGESVKNRVKPKHFTDLVRHFLCPDKKMDCEHNSPPVKNIYATKKLRASGVKFRPLKDTMDP
ncbi:unnamed protein product [Prunus brigantina]